MPETKVNQQTQALTLLVEQAWRNSTLNPRGTDEVVSSDPEDLIRTLASQAPNRIFVSPEGLVSLVFLHKRGNRLYQAYSELRQPENGLYTKRIRSEFLSFPNLGDLEREISLWRRNHNLTGDLIKNPDMVYQTGEEFTQLTALPHSVVAYCYFISVLDGPRLRGLSHRVSGGLAIPENSITTSVPEQLLRYAHPFTT